MFEASQDRVSPTFLQDTAIRGEGLERLAGAARGAMFRLVGSDPRPFDRIRQEMAGHYLLAFEPLPGDRDGRVHQIAVSLRRGAGEVRARRAFRIAPAPPSARAAEEQLVELLRASRPATELPISVATYTYAEPGTARLRIVVGTEAGIAEGPSSSVLLGYVLVDERGVIAASAAHRTETARHAFSTVADPGKYTLRIAAIDALGRRGSVERPFVAGLDVHDGVRVSDLIVSPEPTRPDEPLRPWVDRIRERRIMAYLELYGEAADLLSSATVHVEVAADAASPPLMTVPANLSRPDDAWAIARVVLPLDTLEAGQYVVRAHVSVDGHVHTRVRPITIAVPRAQ